jgi:DNA-binding transcriptional MerR regulator
MRFLNPSKAARRLGVSVKALRIYEQRGLMTPTRTEAGWRSYGPTEMQRGGEVVALRALGLSLAQVASVLKGEAEGLSRPWPYISPCWKAMRVGWQTPLNVFVIYEPVWTKVRGQPLQS